MKKVLVIGISLFLLMAGTALAVDDTTLQEVDNKAQSANTKADGNNSRIQGLEADEEDLQSQINALSGVIVLSEDFLEGSWEAKSYNNGFHGESGTITFYPDHTFVVGGTLSILGGCNRLECPSSSGTYEILDGVLALKLDEVDPNSGSVFEFNYGVPVTVKDEGMILIRSFNTTVLARVGD